MLPPNTHGHQRGRWVKEPHRPLPVSMSKGMVVLTPLQPLPTSTGKCRVVPRLPDGGTWEGERRVTMLRSSGRGQKFEQPSFEGRTRTTWQGQAAHLAKHRSPPAIPGPTVSNMGNMGDRYNLYLGCRGPHGIPDWSIVRTSRVRQMLGG